MGSFLNRGNQGYQNLLNSEICVDKTDMLALINKKLNTEQNCICMSRPRRFGKSVTANMIGAYYDKGCDSRAMFAERKLGAIEGWDRYLNKLDVIKIDFAEIATSAGSSEAALAYISKRLYVDLTDAYEDVELNFEDGVASWLHDIYCKTEAKFVVIIDEWDYIFRDDKANQDTQNKYINLLRALFKGDRAKDFLALAYITGIMPIKRYNSESALNNFYEYTMLFPDEMAPYVGFTVDEVKMLCEKYNMDFDTALEWYDGYMLGTEQHVCGANSVAQAMLRRSYRSYWTSTAAYDSLKNNIMLNFEGLKDDIKCAIAGQRVKVRTGGFQNDMTSFKNKHDVLTLLIHLGYLAYDAESKEAYIPNREVREFFEYTLECTDWDEVLETIENSQRLLGATLAKEAEEVAARIDQSHMQNTSVLKYNDENSLACSIALAYYTARSEYVIVRELPAGYGFADMVFLPKNGVDKPAMVVELKWMQDADSAIRQIKEKRYAGALKDMVDKVLLVGISYDKATKKHSCAIEEWKLL